MNDTMMQQPLIMQPPVGTTPYSSPMHNFQGAITILTDPETEMYKLELALRGMTLDKDNNPRQSGEPLMNEKGIVSTLTHVQSIVARSTNMSNLDEKEISKIMIHQIGDPIIEDLLVHGREYEIKDNTTKTQILTICSNASFITLKRALNEGERRFWKGSQQEITMRNEMMGGSGKNNGGGVLSKVGQLFK